MFSCFRFRRPSPRQELERFVAFAFTLARQTGRPVSMTCDGGPRCISPRLSPRAATSLPGDVPLPPGTLDPRWARAPKPLMVSPWRTATEGMWFIREGRSLLCMHLRAGGTVRFLRYSGLTRTWNEA